MNPDYRVDQADVDYLTDLPNRRGLYRFYNDLGEEEHIHAMFVDIDNFKKVNDIYGHSMGDLLLRCVSDLIRDNAAGFVSRVGGDEFVILMDGDSAEDAVKDVAESIREGIKEINFRPDILSLISLSIGIVMDQRAGQSLDDILARCDSAMYQSKFNGKNKYSIYNSEDKNFEVSRNIEMEMDNALEEHQFRAYLQPKVNMISSEIVGAEALCRWVHPTEGIRMPDVFIPIFEKDGFISKLDMYMFEEVCRIKAGWKGRSYESIPISVNISRLHLYNQSFPEELSRIADSYGIPHNELELEITESIFIKDTRELIEMTERLRKSGFIVSVDDFGSGFSALNLLQDLPVDIVKLDKGFLQSSADSSRGRQVIRSVISMCRDLKIQVVTEGLETKEQIDFITSCSCQIAQGFYYARPLALEEFEEYAQKHKNNILDSFVFPLDNEELRSKDGSLRGDYNGAALAFSDGIFKGSKAVSFPGGKVETNIIEISPKAICNDSWAVSFWIKPDKIRSWSSAVYIKFETGFASFSPLAWEGNAVFRIRDSREVNGWHDTPVCALLPGMWWHVVISYNAVTEKAYAYINGDPVAQSENVPPNRFVKRIILGGDVFQPGFVGEMCEFAIFNESKDFDGVSELFRSYTENPDFNAGELKKLI